MSYLITVEGIEGVGKSTHIQHIVDWLEQRHFPVVATREPGGTQIAEAIRQILLCQHEEVMTPWSEVLLMFAARCQHIEHVIKPALAKRQVVISDRYLDASIAYQGAGRGLGTEHVKQLAQLCQIMTPNLTLVLDASFEVTQERVDKRGARDRFEQEDQAFFELIRQAYLDIAHDEPERVKVIDASGNIESVRQQIDVVLADVFKKSPT